MNDEYFYLIKIIKSVLNNEELTLENEIDYIKLYSIAKHHSVENFLYYGLLKNPNFNKEKYSEFVMRVERTFKESLFKVAVQGAEIEELEKAFEQNKIKYMPLKGVIMRHLYPHIDLRSMADFDCYFDKKEAKHLKKIMISLGYSVELYNKGNHDIYYKKPYMNVEMHRELINDAYKISKYYKNIDDKLIKVQNREYEYQMTNEDFLIFLIAHNAKHFALGGTGIRSFIDLYLFTKHYQELDFDYIYKELDKLSLKQFAKASIELTNYWFKDCEETILINNFEECVFTSGTYGTKANNATINMFMTEEARGNLEKSKIKYIIKRLFPSIEWMNERNPITKKVPILLPWFYFTRLLKGLFHIKSTRKEMKDIENISDENIKKLESLHDDLDVKGKI